MVPSPGEPKGAVWIIRLCIIDACGLKKEFCYQEQSAIIRNGNQGASDTAGEITTIREANLQIRGKIAAGLIPPFDRQR